MNNSISALIVVYNEEITIERCLKSIYDIVDEIILIHDGICNDKTLEIARRYTDRVFEMPENKGAGEFWYMFGLEKCSKDWILKLDADEYLSDELMSNIKELLNNDEVDSYSFVWPVWDENKYIDNDWPYKSALFRKNKICFFENFGSNFFTRESAVKTNLLLEHKPVYYNYSKESFNRKILKWVKKDAESYFLDYKNAKYINIDINSKIRERNIKKNIYRFPLIASFVFLLFNILNNLNVLNKKSFWIINNFTCKYIYYVGKNINSIRRNNKYENRKSIKV